MDQLTREFNISMCQWLVIFPTSPTTILKTFSGIKHTNNRLQGWFKIRTQYGLCWSHINCVSESRQKFEQDVLGQMNTLSAIEHGSVLVNTKFGRFGRFKSFSKYKINPQNFIATNC